MVEEVREVVDNANKIRIEPIPTTIPMYFFISTGEKVGRDDWKSMPTDFLRQVDVSSYMLTGLEHYVHTYNPKLIAEERINF